MTITLTGTLITPIGSAAVNTGIRITSLQLGENDLGKGAYTDYQCDAAGNYSVTLVDGAYSVTYRFGNEWVHQADVVVNADLPAGIVTFTDLFNATAPIFPSMTLNQLIEAVNQNTADIAILKAV